MSFAIGSEYNAILIEASNRDIIELARTFVQNLDKPIAQILIEAWVVEVKLDKLRKYGIQLFSKEPNNASLSKTYYPRFSGEYSKTDLLDFIRNFIDVSATVERIIPVNFAAQLDALESEGITNLISKPQVATLNGYPASITFGTTQYYLLEKETVSPNNGSSSQLVGKDQRFESINVNMVLSVKPWVSSKDEVTMEISPNFDVPGVSRDANLPPTINRRSLNSTVRVKNGEMIILGGLIGESETNSIDQVPFLGSIPILEWIFSTRKIEKSKTQLMIYLIPHIYYGSERTIDPNSINVKDFDLPVDKKAKK